jgi:hypothetical protein
MLWYTIDCLLKKINQGIGSKIFLNDSTFRKAAALWGRLQTYVFVELVVVPIPLQYKQDIVLYPICTLPLIDDAST